MRASQTLLTTQKETPAGAEVISHQLMIRAGLIRHLASGLYTWLPIGLRAMRKVEQIVREEMDRAGALEMFMPAIQPAELWEESGRWEQFGPELLRLQDRHQRDFCVGPTHEEVITDIARRDVRSYKQLPVNMYQIQTKFRDEVRPRFGVMRAREFIMKDAYSFDLTPDGLAASYDRMHAAYSRIFSRFGLDFRIVDADSGAIGGSRSQEFHVLAASGEDGIAYTHTGDFAANVELVPCAPPEAPRPPPCKIMETVDTPSQHTISALSEFLGVDSRRTLKTLVVEGTDGNLVALCLRGDHELNLVKAGQLRDVAAPLTFASAEQVVAATGCAPGSIGPVGLSGLTVIADHAALAMTDFVCGANAQDQHLIGVNWGRDLPEAPAADLRNAQAGDPAPGDLGPIAIARGIEVGHIFQLGTKYSQAMNAVVLDQSGKAQTLYMGCYGIGVTRIVAAAIEQGNDDKGIIWPTAIAPYEVVLLPMNMNKSVRLGEAAGEMYEALQRAGIDVIFDDRQLRPGVMFADAELIGFPYRLVMGERGLDKRVVEIRGRTELESRDIPIDDAVAYLADRIEADKAFD